MKKVQYALMAMGFVTAGLSAMMWYGSGLNTWIWQIACMTWIIDSYFKQKTIDKLEK
jgi:hypothetical protein